MWDPERSPWERGRCGQKTNAGGTAVQTVRKIGCSLRRTTTAIATVITTVQGTAVARGSAVDPGRGCGELER